MLYMEHPTCWDLANVPYMGYRPRPERVKVNFFLWDIKTISRLLAAGLGLDIKEDEEQDPLNFWI